MDEQKLLFGKILGEIYRLQKRTSDNACFVSNSTIYGLLNGVERIVDNEIKSIGYVTREEETVLVDILDEYFNDQEKLENFTGYYEIEDKLKSNGIDRSKAKTIITLLNLENRFTDVIKKMDSSGSPSECRRFDPKDWEI